MNGSADFENIFARISDSKRDFNGFPQRSADSSILGARILDFASDTNIFARISDSGRKFNGGFA